MLKILALISIIALTAFAAGDATFEATKENLIFLQLSCFHIYCWNIRELHSMGC